jgi:lysozyme family protein
MSFQTAYEVTAKFEGGYANSPRDKGGETFRGISRISHPKWDGWPIVDSIKADLQVVRGLMSFRDKRTWALVDAVARKKPGLSRLVADYYERVFYAKVKAWGLAERVTDKLFDLNVNLRPDSAGKVFQRAINGLAGEDVAVDGKVGPKTLARARALAPGELVMAIAKEQEKFYLVNTIPDWLDARDSFLERARWIPEASDG